jgi:hypothetical protein
MRQQAIVAVLALAAALARPPVDAGEVEQRFRVQRRSEAIAEVAGLVCTFCAYGTRKNLEKVPGIDVGRFKRGVAFETAEGVIRLAIDPARPIDVAGIHRGVRDGGYETLALHLYIEGVLDASGDTVLTDAGTGQRFRLVDERGGRWVPDGPGGGRVAVRGAVPAEHLRELTSNELVPMRVVSAVSLRRD